MSTRGLSYKWYGKAKEMLRCRHVNPQMVGYALLLYGICECAEDEEMTEEELYDEMKKNYMVYIMITIHLLNMAYGEQFVNPRF